jgi:hypothetical protein
MIGGNFLITPAVGTKRLAKRQVNIKANAMGMILFMKTPDKKALPGFRFHLLVPKRDGGITGIPRYRTIVLL